MVDKDKCCCHEEHDHKEDNCCGNKDHGHHNHNHDGDHCCGNGGHHHGDGGCCGHHHEEELDIDTVELELEDGSIIECGVLGIFDHNEKSYISLLTLDENQEVYIYELKDIQEDSHNIDLQVIEDEDEYEEVSQVFQGIVDGEIDKLQNELED